MPVHLRTNWDSFYVEILMLAGLGVYFLNFLQGKSKNHKLAQSWLSAHRDILEQNFSIVGKNFQVLMILHCLASIYWLSLPEVFKDHDLKNVVQFLILLSKLLILEEIINYNLNSWSFNKKLEELHAQSNCCLLCQ